MSAPLLVPKGNDRSWNRQFYYALNKIMRRLWWENDADRKVVEAFNEAIMYGTGYLRVDSTKKTN